MILSLGLVTALAGALLGWMYHVTKAPIEAQQKALSLEAIKNVAPKFDNDPEKDVWYFTGETGRIPVYPAYLDGHFQGAAVKASSMNGFSGEITVMCGFNADGTVREYQVLHQAETPGLGAKMQMWFRDPKEARSVIGRNPGRESFYVKQDKSQHGSVDAITAATISSRAFLETLRSAFEAFVKYQESNDKKSSDYGK